jgi:hypothetical protein
MPSVGCLVSEASFCYDNEFGCFHKVIRVFQHVSEVRYPTYRAGR